MKHLDGPIPNIDLPALSNLGIVSAFVGIFLFHIDMYGENISTQAYVHTHTSI